MMMNFMGGGHAIDEFHGGVYAIDEFHGVSLLMNFMGVRY